MEFVCGYLWHISHNCKEGLTALVLLLLIRIINQEVVRRQFKLSLVMPLISRSLPSQICNLFFFSSYLAFVSRWKAEYYCIRQLQALMFVTRFSFAESMEITVNHRIERIQDFMDLEVHFHHVARNMNYEVYCRDRYKYLHLTNKGHNKTPIDRKSVV